MCSATPVAFWEGSREIAPGSANKTAVLENRHRVLAHFLRPEYVPNDQREWKLEMMVLSSTSIFGDFAQPVLLFGLWDASIDLLTSSIADLNPSSRTYCNTINKLFRQFCSQLLHCVEYLPDRIPVAAISKNGRNDEFAGEGP